MKYRSTFWFLSTKLKEGVRQKGQGTLFRSAVVKNRCIELLRQGRLVFNASSFKRTIAFFFLSSSFFFFNAMYARYDYKCVIQQC